jgi:hypothetical protein
MRFVVVEVSKCLEGDGIGIVDDSRGYMLVFGNLATFFQSWMQTAFSRVRRNALSCGYSLPEWLFRVRPAFAVRVQDVTSTRPRDIANFLGVCILLNQHSTMFR